MSARPRSFGRGTPPLPARLTRMIRASGPISIAQFMAEANAAYYGSRDPLGAGGDFVTAPEISQMFGELLGLCLADLWIRHQASAVPVYVELGPGRGTLARDALRAMNQVGLVPPVHLVETSPALRQRQKALLPQAHFHDDLDTLPDDAPILLVANEFFDALPIRQIENTARGWRERVVVPRPDREGEAFLALAGDRVMDAAVPAQLAGAPPGAIIESCPAAATIAFALAQRIARQGGCALIIDYGYQGPAVGDTLQAVRAHKMTDPFEHVGDSDLTAHVDFAMLANIARQQGCHVSGPVGQGALLRALGIDARAHQLAVASPDHAGDIGQARDRLVEQGLMGSLFRALAISHVDWPRPEGFA